MRFPYRKYFEPDTATPAWTVYRPVVPVLLRTPRKAIRKLGLVDTGADFTLLPTVLGEALNIEPDSSLPVDIAGFGDSILKAMPGTVEFELRSRKQSYRWMGRVYLADQDYLLLGNEGFLEFFVATFDWAGKTVELVPNHRFPAIAEA